MNFPYEQGLVEQSGNPKDLICNCDSIDAKEVLTIRFKILMIWILDKKLMISLLDIRHG